VVVKIHFLHPAIGKLGLVLHDPSCVLLGRTGGGAGIELNWDHRISRRHASVSVVGSEVWFEDLGSSNGSWHAGSRIAGKIRFEPSMSLLLGNTVLTISSDADEPPDDPWVVATDVSEFESADLVGIVSDSFDMGSTTKELRYDSAIDRAVAALARAEERLREAQGGRGELRDPKSGTESRRGPSAALPKILFTSEKVVSLFLPSREALREFWTEGLHKTGVFVPTDRPPPIGATVTIELSTPDGEIAVPASVVHLVTPATANQFGMMSGVGLTPNRIDAEVERQINAYVTGEREHLFHNPPAAEPSGDEEPMKQLLIARRLLEYLEARRLYEAIEVAPEARDDEIDRRLLELEHLLAARGPLLRPPQIARLDASLSALARIRRVLMDPDRRLSYDFESGHHRVEERKRRAADGTGPSLEQLRTAWNLAVPGSVEPAAELVRRAFAAAQMRDLGAAIEFAERALALNPFFADLETAVAAWRLEHARGDWD
jgi:pSer/pThr/pTyr-binding forkhead associated (FHA) protein